MDGRNLKGERVGLVERVGPRPDPPAAASKYVPYVSRSLSHQS